MISNDPVSEMGNSGVPGVRSAVSEASPELAVLLELLVLLGLQANFWEATSCPLESFQHTQLSSFIFMFSGAWQAFTLITFWGLGPSTIWGR